MFLRRRSGADNASSEVLAHPTLTVDIKGPTMAYHLGKLGLRPGASWEQIAEAHESLIADLTPSPSASHSNVELANSLRQEVDAAYHALRRFQPAERSGRVS